jgi:hypothetical protein
MGENMRLFAVFPAFFLCLQSLFPIGSNQALAIERNFTIQMKHGPLEASIEYDSDKRDWADYIVQQTQFYLPLAERYLKMRFRYADQIRISHCTDCWSTNQKNWIRLNYHEGKTGNPAVLLHELNHFWFRYDRPMKCQNWLVEGIVSFLPLAMHDHGDLPDTDEYNRLIKRAWEFNSVPPADVHDQPLCPFDESKRTALYPMSFRLQYLLYRIIGPARYLKFLRQYKHLKPRTNREVIAFLNHFSKRNWRSFLRGWVFPGAYTDVAFSDFTRDDDSDGLSNGEEYGFKTKSNLPDTDGDSLPDGAEVDLGLNPLVFDAGADAIIRSHGPFADGLGSDWELFDYKTAYDRAGDEKDALVWTDMLELNYFVKDGVFYLRVKTAQRPEAAEHVSFGVLIDIDNDGHYDHEYAFSLTDHWRPYHYDRALNSIEQVGGLKAGAGDVLEMAIPVGAIPAAAFRIWPIIRNGETDSNYDSWSSWVDVTGE